MSELQLNLPNFSGPLDLLLHLIKSQKIDIYDIPVAQITRQYLDYLHQMQKFNLAVAGEYFVMASTLLRIKSSLILPKNDYVEDADFDENYDPRQELVDQLVQYELFQKVSHFLRSQEEKAPKVLTKEPTLPPQNLTKPLPEGVVTITDLSNTFAVILERFKARQPADATIDLAESSIKEQITNLQELLMKKSKLSFFELILHHQNINYVVTLFLAMLELIKKKTIKVSQSDEFDDLILERIDYE